jgi:ribosomal protein L3 glutamine methyltransferase
VTVDVAVKPADELATVADFLRWMTTTLSRADVYYGHGTDNAWDEALALLCGRLGIAADKLQFVLSSRLMTGERAELVRLLERRIVFRVPVPYLVGEAWFANRRFLIEPGVLIPRSPIGELVDSAFAPWLVRSPERILDIGTGSGCIGIACALTFPDAEVVLSDIDDAALSLARRNVALHQVEDRVRVVRADVFDGLPDERFDLIVTNPPYVNAADLAAMPREFQHEPQRALAAGADGLDIIRRILAQARAWLADDGLLVAEVGASAADLVAAFPDTPFVWPELDRGGHGVFLIDAAGLS